MFINVLQALLPRLHCFQEGTCIVHHLFGAEVSEMLKAAYGDAFLTAHFEVRNWQACCFCHLSFSQCSCLTPDLPVRAGCMKCVGKVYLLFPVRVEQCSRVRREF